MARWKTLNRSSSKCVGGKVPGSHGQMLVGVRSEPLPKTVRRFLAANPVPQKTRAEKRAPALAAIQAATPSRSFSVYTDVSQIDGVSSNPIHVGLVLIDGWRVFRSAVTIRPVQGVCPEDVAIRWAKATFPGAVEYWTDYLTTQEGTPTYRAHPNIQECHKLARAKMRAAQTAGRES